jgi:hypothetical protein
MHIAQHEKMPRNPEIYVALRIMVMMITLHTYNTQRAIATKSSQETDF